MGCPTKLIIAVCGQNLTGRQHGRRRNYFGRERSAVRRTSLKALSIMLTYYNLQTDLSAYALSARTSLSARRDYLNLNLAKSKNAFPSFPFF